MGQQFARLRKRMVVAAVFVTAMSVANAARADDRVDVGLLLGSTRATDEGGVLQFGRGLTYQATFAWRFWTNDQLGVSIEVPFLASPAFEVTTPGNSLPKEYASLYLTPGVRVTVLVGGPISAFGTIGAGYARYSESRLRRDGSPNPSQQDTNSGALEFGGGVDVKTWPWLGFRGEIRDVYTGSRHFSIPTPGPSVQNVVISGGLVLRF
jgi:opacity protein-like surface antigen